MNEDRPIDLKSRFAKAFHDYEISLNGEKESFLFKVRRAAYDKFSETGFPTMKFEDWKYTNLNFLGKIALEPASGPSDSAIEPGSIEKYTLPGIDSNLIVIVNGYFSQRLSRITSRPRNVFIGSLTEGFQKYPEIFINYYARYAHSDGNPLSYLNTAFARDGACVIVQEGKSLTEPVHILNINDSRSQAVFANPRNFIFAEECSEVKIIESNISIGESAGMTNNLTEIIASNFSTIDYTKIQNDSGNGYYTGTTQVLQSRASVLNSATMTLGGRFTRNNLNTILNDELCQTNIYGLYLMNGRNFVDNHTFVDHAMPNSNSSESYKGIIGDEATAVFNGKIIVRQDAQKTNAYQTNRNILLTDTATINTKPQLEIYANDVKCSHGATSGYLDREAMFYLMTRGISAEKAKSLLLNAFASEIVEKVSTSELRDAIKREISDRLKIEDVYFCDVLDQQK